MADSETQERITNVDEVLAEDLRALASFDSAREQDQTPLDGRAPDRLQAGIFRERAVRFPAGSSHGLTSPSRPQRVLSSTCLFPSIPVLLACLLPLVLRNRSAMAPATSDNRTVCSPWLVVQVLV